MLERLEALEISLEEERVMNKDLSTQIQDHMEP